MLTKKIAIGISRCGKINLKMFSIKYEKEVKEGSQGIYFMSMIM